MMISHYHAWGTIVGTLRGLDRQSWRVAGPTLSFLEALDALASLMTQHAAEREAWARTEARYAQDLRAAVRGAYTTALKGPR